MEKPDKFLTERQTELIKQIKEDPDHPARIRYTFKDLISEDAFRSYDADVARERMGYLSSEAWKAHASAAPDDNYSNKLNAIYNSASIVGNLHSRIMMLVANTFDSEEEIYRHIIKMISDTRADIVEKSRKRIGK